jgi:hypothetical protein
MVVAPTTSEYFFQRIDGATSKNGRFPSAWYSWHHFVVIRSMESMENFPGLCGSALSG